MVKCWKKPRGNHQTRKPPIMFNPPFTGGVIHAHIYVRLVQSPYGHNEKHQEEKVVAIARHAGKIYNNNNTDNNLRRSRHHSFQLLTVEHFLYPPHSPRLERRLGEPQPSLSLSLND
ncbi:hypothetical protein DMENIID0001_143900 [Sergentomyia squamirostris]